MRLKEPFRQRLRTVMSGVALALVVSFTAVKIATAAGLPLYPIGLIYYNGGSGKQPGSSTTANSAARAYAYRSNVNNQFSTTDSDPNPGQIFIAEVGDPAYTSWDVGSSQWSNIVAGDVSLMVLETRAGLNGWAGVSWVGGTKTTITAGMLQNLQIDYRDTVMEPIPVVTMQSNTVSSITVNWQGLWDNSTGTSGGSGPSSVVGYSIYRSTDGGAYSLLSSAAQNAGANITYTDSTASTGHAYNYKLGVRFEWNAHAPAYYEPVAQGPASAAMSTGVPQPVLLKFLSSAPTLMAGTNSAVQTVQSSDAVGNALNVTADTAVNLATSSSGGNAKFFSVSGGVCTAVVITNVTITSGTSTAQFCYYDEKAGSWNLTAQAAGLSDATETATVTGGDTLGSITLALATPQKNRAAFTGTNTLTAKDTYGNTMTSFNSSTDNVTFSVAPGTAVVGGLGGSGSAQLVLISDTASGIANLTNRFQLAGASGSYTITATTASGKTDTAPVTLGGGALDHFDFSLISPQSIAAAFTGTNTLTARDTDNNVITDFNASAANVTITESGSSGTVSGLGSGSNNVLNQAGNFVSGVASLTGSMKYTGTAASHSFRATAGSVNNLSNSVNFTTGALAKFGVSLTSPQANAQAFALATITAQDAGSNTIADFDASANNVTLSVSGTGSLNRTSLAAAPDFVGGIADLSGSLTFTGQAGSHTVTATSANGKTGNAAVTITTGPVTAVKIVNGTSAAATEVNTSSLTADQTLPLWAAGYDVSGNWVGLVNGNWSSGGTLAPAVSATDSNTVNFVPTTAPTSGTISFTMGSLSDNTGTVTVGAGAFHHFIVNAPGTATAGAQFTISITAADADGNTVSGYTGSQALSISGPGNGPNSTTPTFPINANFSAGTAAAVPVTLVKAETARITVAQTGKTGQSGDIVVSAGAANSFTVSAPLTATAGEAFDVQITSHDQYGNVNAAYNGSHNIVFANPASAPDGTAPGYPASVEFTGGAGTASVTLYKNETTTIKATESSLNGTSGIVAVSAGAGATITEVSGNHQSGPVSQQLALPLKVIVKDDFDNPKSQYSVGFNVQTGGGNVLLVSVQTTSDGTAQTSWTLGGSPGTDNNTVHATGPGLSGSPVVFMASASGNGFVITTPAIAKTGESFSVQIRAIDMNGATVTTYNGTKTIAFSGPSNGPNGAGPVWPVTVVFVNGVAQPSASVTLVAVETTTLTAADTNASLIGTSDPITVQVGQANKLTIVTAAQQIKANEVSAPVTVCVQDQFGNAVIGEQDRILRLAGTSPGSQFSISSEGAWNSYEYTLRAGLNCLTLFYKDSYAGARTITINSNGLSEASQPINVLAVTQPPGGGTTPVTNNTETTRTITVYVDRPIVDSQVPAQSPTAEVPLPSVAFPTITSPHSGSLVAAYDGSIIFSGTAPAAQTLRLRSDEGEVLGSTTSDRFGQWQLLLSEGRMSGTNQSVYIEVFNQAGVRSTSIDFVIKRPTFWDKIINFVGQ